MVTPEHLVRTKRLALELAGLELFDRHRELLENRGRRHGIRDQAGWESLLDAAEAGNAVAQGRLLGLITTKFTGFFRHARHFELAAQHALLAVRERGHARLWSAAAATGEEPWSLAMALLEMFQRDDPPATILATDVDPEALAIGRKATYHETALRALSPARRDQFMIEEGDTRIWGMTPAVRRLVEFRPLNLAGVSWPVAGPMDVIFCRNVLMYFEAGHRYAVLERMASLLAPDGLLLLDPTEHLGKAAHWFTRGDHGGYSRRREVIVPRRGPTREFATTRA